jgi:hypothetical protein
MQKFIGTNITLGLGCLSAFAAFTPGNDLINMLNLGITLIIGSQIYKSAKRRLLGEALNTNKRKVAELIGLILIGLLIGMQNNLITLIETKPVTNFLAPVWVLVAYLIVALKSKNKES